MLAETFGDEFAVTLLKFHADRVSAEIAGSDESRTAARERVSNSAGRTAGDQNFH